MIQSDNNKNKANILQRLRRFNREITVEKGRSDEYWLTTTKYHFYYSIIGFVIGLLCVIAGVILFLHGVVSDTSWITKILTLETKLTDKAPGVGFAIIGLLVIFISRFKVKSK